MRLFKAFSKLDSKEKSKKGIGIGLNICYKLINQFGGKLSVTSEHTQGSKFNFTFEVEDWEMHYAGPPQTTPSQAAQMTSEFAMIGI